MSFSSLCGAAGFRREFGVWWLVVGLFVGLHIRSGDTGEVNVNNN